MPRLRTKRSKSPMKSLIELVATVAIAVALALLVQAFIVKPYRIPSPSMVPTLAVGQRVLTNRLFNHPSVGDIVVFHPPHGADAAGPLCGGSNQGASHSQACAIPTPQESSQTFIKRVVAGPGDQIAIVNGHVLRNGVAEKDSYTAPCGTDSSCNFRTPIVIPPVEVRSSARRPVRRRRRRGRTGVPRGATGRSGRAVRSRAGGAR